MHVRVKADEAEVAKRVEKVMHFYLTSVASEIDSISVTIVDVSDRLGANLKRCAVDGVMASGDRMQIVETQSDLMVAVTRALDRCVRTIRRRQNLHRILRSA
jgi:hypothetical protein